MKPYREYIKSKNELFAAHGKMSDADFGRTLETKRLGLHWVELPPNHKSSNPHAESLEEEFVFVVSGRPHVWVNGYIYQLEPGFCVGFPAGTGIAHTFINNGSEKAEMIILGDRTKNGNKCSFPINPELKETHKDIWWDTYPEIFRSQEIGPHDGSIGNLEHQKNWQDLAFIKNTSALERKIGFSYPTDTEKFTEGVRLTDHVGLKSLGIWHEIMRPGKRSSWPHAHKIEEEAAILIRGTAKVWLNGFVHGMNPGDCVFFRPGTGVAHVIFNDSSNDIEFLGIGQAGGGGDEDKVFYPLHQTRNEQCITDGYFWSESPKQIEFGSDFGVPKINNLEIKIEPSASEFLTRIKPLLNKREAEYSLLLGVCEARKETNKNPDDYVYISISHAGELIGGVCVTERSLVVSAIEEPCLLALANFLKEKNIQIPGVVGPALTSEALARIWGQLTSQKFSLAMGQKIYQIDAVSKITSKITNKITNIAGHFSVARVEHTELVRRWLLEFTAETWPHQPSTIAKTTELVAAKIKKQEVYLWFDDSQQPVSMNLVGRPTENGISVSGVYTPKSLRKRGFASAVVAHTSQQMLDSGKKFCVLYTDVANLFFDLF